MQIVIECNEYIIGTQAGNCAAVELTDYHVEVKCRKECMDVANKAARAALAILQGEKA